MRQGFDNDMYIRLQSERIRERIAQFGGKLYLEFGGKLFDDNHASRVLPGFQPDSKLRMLKTLADRAEVVIAVNAQDIESNKLRGDLGIGYDAETLRLIDSFREAGLYVGQRGHHPFRRAGGGDIQAAPGKPGHPRVPPLRHRGLSLQPQPHRLGRRLRPQRLYRNQARAGGGHRARPRFGQDGHVLKPALPRIQARHQGRLRQV